MFQLPYPQHHKELQDVKIGAVPVEGGEEEGDPSIADNLLTVARTGNAALLDELLKAKLDPDIGDSKGRTPLVGVYVRNITKRSNKNLI